MEANKETLKDPQIFITREARELFDNMKSRFPEFKSFDNKDFVVLAAMFGVRNKKRKPLRPQDTEKSGFTRERYLSNSEMAVFRALAINEKEDVTIIRDPKYTYSLVEEYCNGGISDLKEFIFGEPGSLSKKLASKLKEIITK